ncbi:MAG: helix-turn-helix transcriptional regulator [Parvularculaceae bacterium]
MRSIYSLPSLSEILADNPGWLEEAVNTRAASRLTGVPVTTLETWRSRGGGPKFLKLGAKTVRYQRRELLKWMTRQQRANTADNSDQMRHSGIAVEVQAS